MKQLICVFICCFCTVVLSAAHKKDHKKQGGQGSRPAAFQTVPSMRTPNRVGVPPPSTRNPRPRPVPYSTVVTPPPPPSPPHRHHHHHHRGDRFLQILNGMAQPQPSAVVQQPVITQPPTVVQQPVITQPPTVVQQPVVIQQPVVVPQPPVEEEGDVY